MTYSLIWPAGIVASLHRVFFLQNLTLPIILPPAEHDEAFNKTEPQTKLQAHLEGQLFETKIHVALVVRIVHCQCTLKRAFLKKKNKDNVEIL